jgi:lipopolysaccharide transport system ATP-binding protein
MKAIIQVRNLCKSYRPWRLTAPRSTLRETLADTLRSPAEFFRGRKPGRSEVLWALRDVSFEVEPGEAIGIIGRNGAGKSTLLKILSRIVAPTAGEVDIYGRVGSLLEIGTGFHPDLTGRENVYLNGSLIGMKRGEIKRKFDEIVAFAEVEQFLDMPIKYYSSGMHVRLAFSVAAHLEPEVLILDEVLAVGDAAFQQKCLHKMRDLRRAGRTILFVSHDLASVRQLCERVLLIESGRLDELGQAEVVIENYLRRVCPAPGA